MDNLDYVRKVTQELNEEISLLIDKHIVYQAIPHLEGNPEMTWRVEFQVAHDPDARLGFDINDQITIGRDTQTSEIINLVSTKDADFFGVSRQHVNLKPTKNRLYVVDLGSTNGTYLNGRRLGVNTPYGLSDGDRLVLGQLEVMIRIVKRPSGSVARQPKLDMLDTLQSLMTSIMPQLSMKQVLKHVIEMMLAYTPAHEACIWLIDEVTDEVLLEVEQTRKDEQLRYVRLPVNDSVVNKVLQTGEVLHFNTQDSEIRTKHLIPSAIYAPIQQGSTTFGVLYIAHAEANRGFEKRDEKIMKLMGELAAIAIQNARQYQAINEVATHQNKVLTALNYGLGYNFKQLVNSIAGYAGLLALSDVLDERSEQHVQSIIQASDQLAQITERINEVVALAQIDKMQFAPLDMTELIESAVDNLYPYAVSKSTQIEWRFEGEPYVVQGHSSYLRRCVHHLIDNAIRHSPPASMVWVTLTYTHNGVRIRVQDSGPGIPEEDIQELFNTYYRNQNSDGLGLGLELVHAVVRAHSGTIVVGNGENGGADFLITLPPMLRVM